MRKILFTCLITQFVLLVDRVLCAKDLYHVMELKRSASQNEIKKKYRELTRKYHPDKNKGNKETTDKYTEINEAYEILSDPKKRRKYDRGGMEAVNDEHQQQNFDPFDVFGMFGGGQARRENRDNDLKVRIKASLKDLYLGREFEYVYTRHTICPHCRGSGADSPDDITVCNKCNGQGITLERQMIAPGFVQQFQRTCPKCNGRGKMIRKTCHVCRGRKIVKSLEELTVYIEKGMPDGYQIKFDEFGEERADINPGDLIFIVEQLQDTTFRREHNDLHTTLRITLKEALLGFQKQIRHLDGHVVEIAKNKVMQPGDVIKIAGEGMPVHQSSEKGDLFVKVEIIFPEKLTEKQIDVAKTFFEKRTYW